MSANVQRLVKEIDSLTPEEVQELRVYISRRHRPERIVEEFQTPWGIARISRPRNRKKPRPFNPIKLPGGPLSDDIIRDRR